MNVFFIVLVSFIIFIVFRYIFVGIGVILSRIFKADIESSSKFSLAMSIVFLITYSQFFIGVVDGFNKGYELSNLEWYAVNTIIGMYSIIWCYYKWELRLNALPKLNFNNLEIALKKVIIFSLVMIFSFYYGYGQTEKIMNGKELDTLLTITNVTIVTGIIALDRVLNQFQVLLRGKRP